MARTNGERCMSAAIKSAYQGINKMEGGPFGAVIIRNGKIIAAASNTVLKTKTATSHAEINAINEASRKLKRFDLSDCEIYSTTEPCPMCFSAIHWARLRKVWFGTSIADVKSRGFNELSISAKDMRKKGKSKVEVKDRFMRRECLELLNAWDKLQNKKTY